MSNYMSRAILEGSDPSGIRFTSEREQGAIVCARVDQLRHPEISVVVVKQ